MRAEVSAATGTTIGVFEHRTPSPNSKRPTCDGASLHVEVSAVTGPLPTKLSTTELQWAPLHAEVSAAATGPHHPDFKTTDSPWVYGYSRTPSHQTQNHQPVMGPPCVLRSVLQQDPITPTPQKLTLNGGPLHAVRAAAKPHRTKLKTTDL